MPDPNPAATSPNPRHILVTGAAGAIGWRVSQGLIERGHRVRGFDLHPMPRLTDTILASITDRHAVDQALEGIDTLVHLAATPDEADFLQSLLGPNIEGLYVVMDAARRHNLRRIILASSMQTVNGIPRQPLARPITGDDLAPTNHYGLTKIFAEQMGEMYHRCHGLSVIAARIGWVPRSKDRLQRHANIAGSYLSHIDAQQFFIKAVEAEPVGFHILFAMSRPITGPSHYDMQTPRQVIGYEPLYAYPDGTIFR